MSKLKKCPFCGVTLTNEKPSKIYVHEKTGCILDFRGFTEEDYSKWNTRKPMERILERLEEALKVHETQAVFSSDSERAYMKAIKIVKEEGGIE